MMSIEILKFTAVVTADLILIYPLCFGSKIPGCCGSLGSRNGLARSLGRLEVGDNDRGPQLEEAPDLNA